MSSSTPHRPRYMSCVDVHLILRRAGQVLLGRRMNTGFADGCWHLPAGHLEDGESATDALIREAEEEIGILVDTSDVRFVHLMHHHTNSGRIALFFDVTRWSGEVVNNEPDKCAGWDWWGLDELPEDMIPYARDALARFHKGETYSERGWDSTIIHVDQRSQTSGRGPRAGDAESARAMIGAFTPAARAVLMAWARIRPQPFAEAVLPLRNRARAITGAESGAETTPSWTLRPRTFE